MRSAGLPTRLAHLKLLYGRGSSQVPSSPWQAPLTQTPPSAHSASWVHWMRWHASQLSGSSVEQKVGRHSKLLGQARLAPPFVEHEVSVQCPSGLHRSPSLQSVLV